MPGNVGKGARIRKEVNKKQIQCIRTYLSGYALMSLLISSAEVFKKESLGYLLGYRLDDRFIIERAFSLQSARRKRRGVVLSHKDQKKIEPILSKFEKLQIIGDFHSHTSYGDKKGLPILSELDISSMEVDNLYVIVAINENLRSSAWRENRDGTISGSVGGFFFKISAFYLNKGLLKPRKSRIFCSFPPGLNAD